MKNLLEDIEGRLPRDKDKMLGTVNSFLGLEPEKRVLFQVGRRMGMFRSLDDMSDAGALRQVEETCRLHGITPETVDAVIDDMMKRFV